MKKFLRFFAAFVAVLTIAIFAARLILPLPDISDRVASRAIPTDPNTRLGQLMAERAVQNPDKTGVIPLPNGHDALTSRLALADAAEHSIDSQYYIWHDDTSGIMLLDALYKAAQRGVRVRLLLDDNGVPGLDSYMAALNAQDNFEIRLFNPSTVRSPKLLGYTFDFFRMNRRMHNKSFIVDGAAAIIGGRNIGDEYFQVGEDNFYIDMDVLATGAVVPETTAVFDDYWNSNSVFAVDTIIDGQGDLAAFVARAAEVASSDNAVSLTVELESSAERYAQNATTMEWTGVQLVADDPIKGEGVATRDQLMITRLGDILGDIATSLDLVSAYFVPGQAGTQYIADLAETGVDVRILTNALDTTDVLMVHAGYSRYRRALLKAGVSLFELKLRGNMASEADLQLNPIGLSGASLHAKTFAVDNERVFIGSFNFDPRSAMLNCEMGFLINSPTLAHRITMGFDGPLSKVSYQPKLTPDGDMIWIEPIANNPAVIYQKEPGTTWLEQVSLVVIGLLPIEWLL